MAPQAPAPPNSKSVGPTNNQVKAKPKTPAGPAPAEEPFWNRYSPHHEFPLSSATSIALHVLAFVGLIVAGWVLARMLVKRKLEGENNNPAGGGGEPRGGGKAPGGCAPAFPAADGET